jgi:hypothetical protein
METESFKVDDEVADRVHDLVSTPERNCIGEPEQMGQWHNGCRDPHGRRRYRSDYRFR